LLAFNRLPWRTRLAHGIWLAGISGLPMVGWLVYSYLQTGGLGERTLRTSGSLWQATTSFRLAVAEILWEWLPFSAGFSAGYGTQKAVLGLLFLSMLAGGMILGWLHIRRPQLRQANQPLLNWVGYWALMGLCFLLIYALAYVYSVPKPDLNERLFSPLYVAAVFSIFGLMYLAVHTWPRLRLLVGLPLLALILTAADSLPDVVKTTQSLHQEGSGYTSSHWSQSPMIAALKQLPQDTIVITNEADAVLFLTGHPTVWLPDVIATQPMEADYRFGDSPQNLREETAFRERGAALAIFPSITLQLQSLYGERANERLDTLTEGLAVYTRFGPLEAIYFYRPEYLP
jgi:hypothetical protein